ncbi:uncharacterized protein SPAPADRAFT_51854, partial [Spathaspora passalidarum NRRL Y-27907]
MWIICLIIFIRAIFALTVTNSLLVVPPPLIYTNSEAIVVDPSGTFEFSGQESISFQLTFTNKGNFITSGNKLKKFTISDVGKIGAVIFENTGKMRIQMQNDSSANTFEMLCVTFLNTGEIIVDSTAKSGQAKSTIKSTLSWQNRGTIIIKNTSPTKATYEQACKPLFLADFIIKNSGVIKLYNQYYKQSTGNIVGNGCIYLEDGTVGELTSAYSTGNQKFVLGEDAILRVTGSKTQTYIVWNFHLGNQIGVSTAISKTNGIVYDAEIGLLTLNAGSTIMHFLIGKGYDPDLFRIEKDGKHISYQGPAPEDPYQQYYCRTYPFDDDYEGEETPKSTTYVTTYKHPNTTFTALVSVFTKTKSVWITDSKLFEHYTTTFIEDTATITGEVIVSTDDQHEWYTSTYTLSNFETSSSEFSDGDTIESEDSMEVEFSSSDLNEAAISGDISTELLIMESTENSSLDTSSYEFSYDQSSEYQNKQTLESSYSEGDQEENVETISQTSYEKVFIESTDGNNEASISDYNEFDKSLSKSSDLWSESSEGTKAWSFDESNHVRSTEVDQENFKSSLEESLQPVDYQFTSNTILLVSEEMVYSYISNDDLFAETASLSHESSKQTDYQGLEYSHNSITSEGSENEYISKETSDIFVSDQSTTDNEDEMLQEDTTEDVRSSSKSYFDISETVSIGDSSDIYAAPTEVDINGYTSEEFIGQSSAEWFPRITLETSYENEITGSTDSQEVAIGSLESNVLSSISEDTLAESFTFDQSLSSKEREDGIPNQTSAETLEITLQASSDFGVSFELTEDSTTDQSESELETESLEVIVNDSVTEKPTEYDFLTTTNSEVDTLSSLEILESSMPLSSDLMFSLRSEDSLKLSILDEFITVETTDKDSKSEDTERLVYLVSSESSLEISDEGTLDEYPTTEGILFVTDATREDSYSPKSHSISYIELSEVYDTENWETSSFVIVSSQSEQDFSQGYSDAKTQDSMKFSSMSELVESDTTSDIDYESALVEVLSSELIHDTNAETYEYGVKTISSEESTDYGESERSESSLPKDSKTIDIPGSKQDSSEIISETITKDEHTESGSNDYETLVLSNGFSRKPEETDFGEATISFTSNVKWYTEESSVTADYESKEPSGLTEGDYSSTMDNINESIPKLNTPSEVRTPFTSEILDFLSSSDFESFIIIESIESYGSDRLISGDSNDTTGGSEPSTDDVEMFESLSDNSDSSEESEEPIQDSTSVQVSHEESTNTEDYIEQSTESNSNSITFDQIVLDTTGFSESSFSLLDESTATESPSVEDSFVYTNTKESQGSHSFEITEESINSEYIHIIDSQSLESLDTTSMEEIIIEDTNLIGSTSQSDDPFAETSISEVVIYSSDRSYEEIQLSSDETIVIELTESESEENIHDSISYESIALETSIDTSNHEYFETTKQSSETIDHSPETTNSETFTLVENTKLFESTDMVSSDEFTTQNESISQLFSSETHEITATSDDVSEDVLTEQTITPALPSTSSNQEYQTENMETPQEGMSYLSTINIDYQESQSTEKEILPGESITRTEHIFFSIDSTEDTEFGLSSGQVVPIELTLSVETKGILEYTTGKYSTEETEQEYYKSEEILSIDEISTEDFKSTDDSEGLDLETSSNVVPAESINIETESLGKSIVISSEISLELIESEILTFESTSDIYKEVTSISDSLDIRISSDFNFETIPHNEPTSMSTEEDYQPISSDIISEPYAFTSLSDATILITEELPHSSSIGTGEYISHYSEEIESLAISEEVNTNETIDREHLSLPSSDEGWVDSTQESYPDNYTTESESSNIDPKIQSISSKDEYQVVTSVVDAASTELDPEQSEDKFQLDSTAEGGIEFISEESFDKEFTDDSTIPIVTPLSESIVLLESSIVTVATVESIIPESFPSELESIEYIPKSTISEEPFPELSSSDT